MLGLPWRGRRTLRNVTEHHRSKTVEEQQIADLTNLNRTKLRELWRDLYGSDPPEKISDLLMRQAIAHRLQVKHLGGLNFSTRRALKRLLEESSADAAQTSLPEHARQRRNRVGARVARRHPSGDGDREGGALPGKTLPLTLGSRTRDHGNALVGSSLLRSPNTTGGVSAWNKIAPPSGAARFTPAKSPRRAWSRTSIPCMRNERRAKLTSPAKAREGWRLITTSYDDGGLSGGTWSVRPCTVYWPISRKAEST